MYPVHYRILSDFGGQGFIVFGLGGAAQVSVARSYPGFVSGSGGWFCAAQTEQQKGPSRALELIWASGKTQSCDDERGVAGVGRRRGCFNPKPPRSPQSFTPKAAYHEALNS